MMESMRLVLVTVCCLATLISGDSSPSKRTYPPRIIKHPLKEIAYKVGDRVGGRVELPCVASAVPAPTPPPDTKVQPEPDPSVYGEDGIMEWEGNEEITYSWYKDGKPLFVTGTDIKKQPGTGTLIIEEPLTRHEGIYQCFAKNNLGTALSIKALLKQAILEPFDTVSEPTVHEVEIGASLVLRCTPPKSYPTGTVYWGESTANNKFQPLTMSDRVAQDYEGNLYYANIILSDAHGGATYVCVAYNNVIRGLVQGDDSKISPQRLTGNTQHLC
jgi:hypothetical protein